MHKPVITLIVDKAAVRNFNGAPPSVTKIVSRSLRAVVAGAFNVHQPVPRGSADAVLQALIEGARERNIPLMVLLPSGEVVDSALCVVRPAASVVAFPGAARVNSFAPLGEARQNPNIC